MTYLLLTFHQAAGLQQLIKGAKKTGWLAWTWDFSCTNELEAHIVVSLPGKGCWPAAYRTRRRAQQRPLPRKPPPPRPLFISCSYRQRCHNDHQ
jgi:hypothetical protein